MVLHRKEIQEVCSYIEIDIETALSTEDAARRLSKPGHNILDQGPGMDKETLENIFVPFYTRKAGGTGLGMSITKKIIEGHRGTIRINSYPGKGTEIILGLALDNRLGSNRH